MTIVEYVFTTADAVFAELQLVQTLLLIQAHCRSTGNKISQASVLFCCLLLTC